MYDVRLGLMFSWPGSCGPRFFARWSEPPSRLSRCLSCGGEKGKLLGAERHWLPSLLPDMSFQRLLAFTCRAKRQAAGDMRRTRYDVHRTCTSQYSVDSPIESSRRGTWTEIWRSAYESGPSTSILEDLSLTWVAERALGRHRKALTETNDVRVVNSQATGACCCKASFRAK